MSVCVHVCIVRVGFRNCTVHFCYKRNLVLISLAAVSVCYKLAKEASGLVSCKSDMPQLIQSLHRPTQESLIESTWLGVLSLSTPRHVCNIGQGLIHNLRKQLAALTCMQEEQHNMCQLVLPCLLQVMHPHKQCLHTAKLDTQTISIQGMKLTINACTV